MNTNVDEVEVREHEIVLGIDGSAHNEAAVAWAIAEAARSGRPLVIASASIEYIRPIPMFSANFNSGEYDEHARGALARLVASIAASHPEVRVRTMQRPTDPARLILDASEHADLVVLGKRGLGAFARVLVGSTSLAVAGRATCPTLIVPDGWVPSEAARPIVLGVDPQRHDDAAVAFAFQRAADVGAPLVALHAWQTHPAFPPSTDELRTWATEAEWAVADLIAPWREKFPEVDVSVAQEHDHPAFALLEQAEDAQLVVLGRHPATLRVGGFAFGSVTRAVLHYATVPVAVVPIP